ncbi:MAG: multiheme c-type cytochrome ExtKL [Thermodesulfovibrionales bacterium]|nr:multiheme c-type cytochrome ExtKL [Thermodesulfovibrionales bacterium]
MFSLLVVSLIVFAGTANAKLADTLDELEKMYPSAETCKQCHADLFEQWNMSVHKEAVLHSLGGINSFVINGIGKEPERRKRPLKAEMMKCFTCHAPQMADASDKLVAEIVEAIKVAPKKDDPGAAAAKAKLARLNVNCYVCHNIKAEHAPSVPEKGAMYGLKGTGKSPFHVIKKGEFLDNAVFCMQCHGVSTAPDGEQIMCNSLSQSYRDSYVADGGQETCQDCHMKKKNRGHTFPGAYVLDTLREGIGLKVNARAIKDAAPGVAKWLPAAALTIDLVNNAGHRIPDG